MDVGALEAREGEGGGHFDVAVHALFAENRHPGRALRLGRLRTLRVGVVGQAESHPGVVLVESVVVFLSRRNRIVAQRLHPVRRLAPMAADECYVGLYRLAGADRDGEAPSFYRLADRARVDPRRLE